MIIDRYEEQGGINEAIHRLNFVLNKIEELEDLDFSKKWGKRLTYEEIIGALVSAEQELKKIKSMEDSQQ